MNEQKLNPTSEDINLWRSKAIQLRAELASIGKVAGTTKMLQIANIEFNMKIKGTDLHCTSIQDVLNIIGDQEWYNEDKPTRIGQIYMLVYGLTRQGFNQWLLDLEQDWMRKNGVTYITKSGRQDLMYNSRGSIYSLLKKVFNNSVTKQFRQKMWYSHKEYICVRMKQVSVENENVEFQQIDCRWGKVYLCSAKKIINISNYQSAMESETSNLTTNQCNGKSWVINCLTGGMDRAMIHKYVDRWAESYSRHQRFTMTESKLYVVVYFY